MEEQLNVKELLEWYITAGVDAICGDQPWEKNIVAKVDTSVQKVENKVSEDIRPATTELAQATVIACQNARQQCSKAETLEELKTLVENFEGCSLRLTANKTVFGYGSAHADLLLIGEAPGADEDRSGIPFVGRSGHLLDKMLQAIQIKREDCFVTNVLPWRPPGNRTPTEGETAVCLPFLKRQIDLVKPKVILILGGSAANALLDNGESISKLRGKWLEYKISDGTKIPVLASFHPAYLLRNSGQKAKAWSDLLRVKQKLCEN
ncbi:MAG: uracil-DNA glycosylase [Alphaproteobacteria bacterium]|nr:uracil-DNA glycosylase [Alphaproteobacteria bacterium]